MPFSELENFVPGYIFDFKVDANEPIIFRANGIVIGQCLLVEIQGRLGAQVVSVNPPLVADAPVSAAAFEHVADEQIAEMLGEHRITDRNLQTDGDPQQIDNSYMEDGGDVGLVESNNEEGKSDVAVTENG